MDPAPTETRMSNLAEPRSLSLAGLPLVWSASVTEERLYRNSPLIIIPINSLCQLVLISFSSPLKEAVIPSGGRDFRIAIAPLVNGYVMIN